MISLLQGRFDESVMADLSRQNDGLFPIPSEIEFDCSCPDWADMCKHVAAVLYGVGARLDDEPEMLFLLRGVDHLELVTSHAGVDSLVDGPTDSTLADQDLSQIFGIEFDDGIGGEVEETVSVATTGKTQAEKATTNKKTAKRKSSRKIITKAAKKKTTQKTVAKKKSAKKKSTKKQNSKKSTQATKKKAIKKKTPE